MEILSSQKGIAFGHHPAGTISRAFSSPPDKMLPLQWQPLTKAVPIRCRYRSNECGRASAARSPFLTRQIVQKKLNGIVFDHCCCHVIC